MPLFKARPVEVEAIHYMGNAGEAAGFVGDTGYVIGRGEGLCLRAKTTSGPGVFLVLPGEWIVWLGDRKFEVLGDEEFRERYEEVTA